MARAGTKSAKANGGGKPARSSAPPKTATEIDLTAMDRAALIQLRDEVDRELRNYDKRRRDDALREIEQVAQRHGLSLKELARQGPIRNATAPKFRHPENPALTWSGRGRHPAWFKEAIDAGRKRDDLLIA